MPRGSGKQPRASKFLKGKIVSVSVEKTIVHVFLLGAKPSVQKHETQP